MVASKKDGRGFELKRSHLAREIVETVALTLLIFLVIRFVIQSYHVDGLSMEPTLNTNEYVLVNKAMYLFQSPQRGDVVVFHYPKDPNVDYIKRIIALPGDVVSIDGKSVIVNGVPLKEPYISSSSTPVANVWKVPPDKYFVLGDNRPVSDDSRYWGCVPKDYIVGKAVAVYWPIPNWEFIDTHSSVYAKIKDDRGQEKGNVQPC
jgi:signal peptidase I